MSNEEIENFLHGEELVPVTFLKDLEGAGFIVNTEQTDADIPTGYSANIPFWIADILTRSHITKITPPDWLTALTPGATINDERSFDFSALLAKDSDRFDYIEKLSQLATDRIDLVLTHSMKTVEQQSGKKNGPAFFTEEKEIIRLGRESAKQFYDWKSTGTCNVKRLTRKHFENIDNMKEE